MLEAHLGTRRANERAAGVGLAAAKQKLARAEQAGAAGAGSGEDVDRARAEVDEAAAQLDVRKSEVREAEARLRQAKTPAGGPSAAPTVVVFNMAAVMRDFAKAKYQVHLLAKRREAVSRELVGWRAEYTKLQEDVTSATDPTAKDAIGREMTVLYRKIEDKGKEIDKALNDEASAVISKLYDEIKGVVDAIATTNGYHLVLAYPDAVTEEEQKNPYLRELKLKPPAAQPFFVHPRADITAEVTRRLNAEHPPLDDQGRKVDVSRLPPATPPAPPARPRN
ncbi:MAG: OmpH family outer membrane protein [Gemmataceae bacterium]|nr:OmpH family outer membrane protein [Gemmataceae bacterium]